MGLFYWNRIDFIMIGDYFTKFIIVRKLPNSSTHAVVKEIGMVFTKFGWSFMLRSDNGPCYSSKWFKKFLEFNIPSSPHHKQPTLSTEQWIYWSSGGHFKEVDVKVHQRWKAVELQIIAASHNPNFQHHSITTWSLHREETQDFASSDPFIDCEDCGKFQDLTGTHKTSAKYFHQLQYKWISNQDSLYSSRKYLETSGRQEQSISLLENQILIG